MLTSSRLIVAMHDRRLAVLNSMMNVDVVAADLRHSSISVECHVEMRQLSSRCPTVEGCGIIVVPSLAGEDATVNFEGWPR